MNINALLKSAESATASPGAHSPKASDEISPVFCHASRQPVIALRLDRAELSFGTQIVKRSRFVEILLSTIETCRQQQRDELQFFIQFIKAHVKNQRTPSLLT